MTLSDLLSGVRYQVSSLFENLDSDVGRVVTDSRKIKEGDFFLAMPSLSGQETLPYIEQAFQKGAVAILVCEKVATGLEGTAIESRLISVPDIGRARAHIAAKLNPKQPAHIGAVTGTNGKTSSVHFFAQLCQGLNKQVGTIGTLGVTSTVSLDGTEQTQNSPQSTLTSPDPFFLHETLHHMASAGVSYLGMEASSHGLAQKRLDAVDLKAAAFTNLSHDHLDYHGTMDAYFEAKQRLFGELLKPGFTAVLNMDDGHGPALERLCRERSHKLLRYGREGEELKILDVSLFEGGQNLDLKLFGQHVKISLSLVGVFQAYNVLCALGLALGVGFKIEEVLPLLPGLKNVPGRLEFIGHTKKGGGVFVDYAHTPDALESALTSLKPHVKGLLTVVFGCGGNRDAAKRPLMGHVAHRHAQKVYVTDDNPRNEDPRKIRQDILVGCSDGIEQGDRRQAIEEALKGLSKGSVCVIAGKGHETGQIVGDEVIDFDDRAVVRELLGNE